MDILEDIPPERRYYTPDIPNNIIIVAYNIMGDIQYYYYILVCSNIHYKQGAKFKSKFNRRI